LINVRTHPLVLLDERQVTHPDEQQNGKHDETDDNFRQFAPDAEVHVHAASKSVASRGRKRILLSARGQMVKLHAVETSLEKSLLDALVELDNAVKSMPTANPKPNLLPIFSRLDELTKQMPRDTDPTLLHYLQKKSYEKARLWLQGRDTENQMGNCRHV
jgi:hypothetical protein